MVPKEFVNYQNNLYWVYKRISQNKIKDGYVNDVKEFWNCDVVVKHKDMNSDNLLFLRLVEDAEIVRDLI